MAKMRAYFKLDLYFFEHPKVVDLSHAATVLYIASIAYSNRRETDGFVAASVLRRLIEIDPYGDDPVDLASLAAELVKAELWELVEGGWEIHDFLEHNDSSEERDERRQRDAARKRDARAEAKNRPNGPKPPSKGPSGNVHPDASDRPDGQDSPSEVVHGIAVAVTEQSDNRGKVNTVVEQARPIDDTTAVFAAWQDVTRKHKAKLDPKRRRRINTALRHYPLEDILDAVRGWQHSPHHCGQNQTGTVYNDLDLLLRDASHIETFRDLWRDGPPAVLGPQTARAANTYRQMQAMGEGVNGDLGGMDPDRRQVQRELPAPTA